ncbi:hypothetical protein SLS55_000087 [Diplodia seriata]|uniref:Uncharacterized protein n=1 Tax=Diplodia seriata TaxID=420778 RepID=A0ABR3CTB3_9PEZI
MRRKPYSPTFYVPHANVLRSSSAEEPYYTPKIELGALWDAANGKARPEGWRTYALQMHCRKPSKPSHSHIDGEESFVFGASPVQPFYSLEQALIDKDTNACEVLISRNDPTRPRDNAHSLPIAHLAIQTPPPHGPLPTPPGPDLAVPPQATPITTITPKLATLAALEAAAQSPRASEIASFDPKAESPAAAALAGEAVAACEAQNACALRYCPVAEPLMPPYEQGKTGTYELRHPALGAFPVVVQGDVRRCLEAARETTTTSNNNNNNTTNKKTKGRGKAAAARTPSPPVNNHITPPHPPPPPTTITLLNPFAAPRSTPANTPEHQKPNPYDTTTSNNNNNNAASSPSRPPSPAPDEVLARLALHTATLTIDAAALAALGTDKTNPSHAHSPHPHVIDVAVAAVLAVLVAERRRGGVPAPVVSPAPPHVSFPAARGRPTPGGVEQVYGGGTWPSPSPAGPGAALQFDGPPTPAARRWPGMEAVGPRELVREKVRVGSWGWWFGSTEEREAEKARKREGKARTGKGVVDIEMGRGVRGLGAGERKEKDEGLHWLLELLVMLVVFAFKVVWFLLTVLFKVLGKVVGVVNRCAAKA